MQDIDFSKVKLIVWDLDDTFWSGTLSEGPVTLNPNSVDLIQQTLDAGIVHSICSKNDFDTAKKVLLSFNLWEVFVFPSINWEAKGERIKEIINTMRLRNENTLFVDDNQQNLKEAVFYCPGIQTMMPYELDKFLVASQSWDLRARA